MTQTLRVILGHYEELCNKIMKKKTQVWFDYRIRGRGNMNGEEKFIRMRVHADVSSRLNFI